MRNLLQYHQCKPVEAASEAKKKKNLCECNPMEGTLSYHHDTKLNPRTGLWSLWYNVTIEYVSTSYAATVLTGSILGILDLFFLDYPALGLTHY